jgi:hypothetical protein
MLVALEGVCVWVWVCVCDRMKEEKEGFRLIYNMSMSMCVFVCV